MRKFLLFWVLATAFLSWLGATCVNYVLSVLFHHTIPFIWALLLAVVTGDIALPVAIVVKALVLLHVLHG